MKKLPLFIAFLFTLSCSNTETPVESESGKSGNSQQQQEQQQDQRQQPEVQRSTPQIDETIIDEHDHKHGAEDGEKAVPGIKSPTGIGFPQKYLGSYISTAYLEELQKHGSTKKAQKKGIMSTANFLAGGPAIYMTNTWNFHEGGAREIISMVSENEAIATGEGLIDTSYRIKFTEDEVIITGLNNSYKLTKFSDIPQNKDIAPIINQNVFTGKLFYEGKEVKFNADGTITGLPNYFSYAFNIDYYLPGMEYDMVYITHASDLPPELYGYEMTKDKFVLFQLKCDEYEDGDNCVKRSRGVKVIEFQRR